MYLYGLPWLGTDNRMIGQIIFSKGTFQYKMCIDINMSNFCIFSACVLCNYVAWPALTSLAICRPVLNIRCHLFVNSNKS